MDFKENDIRPANLMKQKEPALEHDKKFLRDRRSEFVEVPCPACGTEQREHWASKEGFDYSVCNLCRTIYMNPRASQDLIIQFYQQSQNYEFWNNHIFPASDHIRRERIFKPRAQRVVQYAKKYNITSGTLLEVGAAFGTFCEAIREYSYFDRIIAVEPTPSLAETCRKKGLETFEQPIEKVILPNESVDIIANFEVIEHLFDPHSFISSCVKFLKTNGLFICTCPSGEGLGTLVLKENARVIDHEHLNYFNPTSLKLLFSRVGLETIELLTPGELDVDLLMNAYEDNKALFSQSPFIVKILESNEDVKADFQEFLKRNLLSSHLWIIGRKKM